MGKISKNIGKQLDKMLPLSQKGLTAGSHPAYVTGDVTNATSLKQAADLLQGELFISCEGLLTYLNTSELEQAIHGKLISQM